MKKFSLNMFQGGGGTAERPLSLVSSDCTTKKAKLFGGCVAAFTMAEILLSLTIIGIIAAITLPSLTGNINERTWNTQRKALYARISQAISLMPALNGFGTYRAASGSSGTSSYDAGSDTAAETFVTGGLSKVLKINNICDSTHLSDCGIVSSYTDMGGSQHAFATKVSEFNDQVVGTYCTGGEDIVLDVDSKVAAFETANGESIAVYYNPKCLYRMSGTSSYTDADQFIVPKICANFVYDLNGSKGPNTVGKDIGAITVFYPADSEVVAPIPVGRNASGTYTSATASSACKDDAETRLPNRLELASFFYNQSLYAMPNGAYLSGSAGEGGKKIAIQIISGAGHSLNPGALYTAGVDSINGLPSTDSGNVRCVRR